MFNYLSRSLKPRKNITEALAGFRDQLITHLTIPEDGQYRHLTSPQRHDYMGLSLVNRIGLGAGFDVNGDYLDVLGHCGFGFIEIGTVSPDPVTVNEDSYLHKTHHFHHYPRRSAALGIDYTIEQLKASRYRAAGGIIGINIAPNPKTPMNAAHHDYELCLNKSYDYVSYITVNIQQTTEPLEDYWFRILQHLKKQQLRMASKKKKYVPLLMKLQGHFSEKEMIDLCHISTHLHIDGLITTGDIYDHQHPANYQCGQHIRESSERQLRQVVSKTCPSSLCILASGGIQEPNDIAVRFQMGADLVQVMSGFVEKKQDFLTACLTQAYTTISH